MKNLYALLALMISLNIPIQAQNPAGKSMYRDVVVFNSPGPGQGVIRNLNCGGDASLAFTSAMTAEFWFKAAIPTDNQKFIGRLNSTGATFNNGYLVGINNSRINPEIWTPTNQSYTEGFIPPVSTWHHVAVTYESGGMYRAYLNGALAYEQAAAGNIAVQNADLIIGVGPWGNMDAFMSFGDMDEIRLWNVARTAEEIKGSMFSTLSGNEAGLVLYQNFDNDNGSTIISDLSSAGNDCTKVGMDATNIIDSECVIANASTQNADDLNGIWFSSNAFLQDPRVVDTENGLSLSANFNGQDTSSYVVWGHDGGSDTSVDDLPANAPMGAIRTARTWSATVFGDIAPNLTFNLENAAGGATPIPGNQDANFYTLLERSSTTGNFTAIAAGDAINGFDVTFNNVAVEDGAYYAIAVGDAPFVLTNIFEVDENELAVSIFPNPSDGRVNVQIDEQIQTAEISIFNTVGQLVNTINTNNKRTEIKLAESGIYLLRIEADGKTFNQRVLVK